MTRLAQILAERARREQAAPGLGEPAWVMLLVLIQCESRGRKCSVTGLAAGSFVPHSTALRHIGELVRFGLAVRLADPCDKRRTWALVTERGRSLAGFVLSQANWEEMAGVLVARPTSGDSYSASLSQEAA